MTEENLLVRILGSCETMANASVVCTDKTGTLTRNLMSAMAGSISIDAKFVRNLKENKVHTNTPDQEQDITDAVDEPQANRKHADDSSTEQSEIDSILSPQLKHLSNQSITINSTFEDVDAETGDLSFVRSKIETALLQFAKDLGWENWKETRESTKIVQMIPFYSERKVMGVVVRLNSCRYRLFLKGASEILTKRCTPHVVVSKNADQQQGPNDEIETKAINEFTKVNISRTIIFYANQMLRTLALCYWDFDTCPPPGIPSQSADEVPYEDLSRNICRNLGAGGVRPLSTDEGAQPSHLAVRKQLPFQY